MRTLLICTLLAAAACAPDDAKSDDSGSADGADGADGGDGSDGADGTDGSDGSDGTDGGADSDLVAAWRSEGTDLAPFFRNSFFDYKKVDVDFASDGTYSGRVETNAGQVQDVSGTYTVDEGTSPATIDIQQLSPQEIRSEGIWQVDGSSLTYEIVTVDPDQGCTPATPTGGFGSTTCSSVPLEPGDLTQYYQRQ